jgi:hypothetical protein
LQSKTEALLDYGEDLPACQEKSAKDGFECGWGDGPLVGGEWAEVTNITMIKLCRNDATAGVVR